MAINLWELGGQPTSYYPLPASSMDNRVELFPSEFILTFKARSDTQDDLAITGVPAFNLTTEWESYKFEFDFRKQSNPYLRFYDGDSATTIEIEDIMLVEKSAGRATINGLDDFGSGKWKFHANATVIDENTFELNAVSSWQASYIKVPVEPNTTYTISRELPDKNSMMYVQFQDKDGKALLGGPNTAGNSVTFKTLNNCTQIQVSLDNGSYIGKTVIKSPMLVLGSRSVPYEKKKGERMVLPKPLKNLFNYLTDEITNVGGYITLTRTSEYIEADVKKGGFGFKFINVSVKPNTDYTFSLKDTIIKGDTVGIRIHFMDTNVYTPAIKYGTVYSFNSGSNTSLALMYYVGLEVQEDSIVRVYDMQLEEGLKATPYEPFKARVDNPSIRSYTKNLLPPFTSGSWALTGTNLKVLGDYEIENKEPLTNYEGSRYALTNFKRGQTYTISFDDCTEDTKIWIHYINGGYTARQDSSSVRGAKSYTFTAPTDIAYDVIRVIFDNATSRNRMWVKNPIMSESSTPVKFEPLKMNTNPSVRAVKAVQQLESRR
jgi:hypothetical protein